MLSDGESPQSSGALRGGEGLSATRYRLLERAASVRRVLAGILLANWAVAAAKLVSGIAGQSAALTADGLHSFLDVTSNIVGLVAMAVAAKPADAEHPTATGSSRRWRHSPPASWWAGQRSASRGWRGAR